MRPVQTILIALLAGLIANDAAAETLKVPKQFGTIQAAIDAAVTGDDIRVSRGTYREEIVIQGKSGITITGKGRPRIISPSDGILIDSSSSVTIERIRIQRAAGSGVFIDSSNQITIRQCDIRSCDSDGIFAENSSNLQILDNRIQRVGDDGIGLGVGGAVDVDDSLVRGNRIRNAGYDGIGVEGSSNRIEKNKVTRVEDVGIYFYDGQTTGENNRVTRAGCGFLLLGNQNVLRNCSARKTADGFLIDGSSNSLYDLKVASAKGGGITLDGNSNSLIGFKVIKVGATALMVQGDHNSGREGRIARTGEMGLEISGSYNSFREYSVSKAGQTALSVDGNNNSGREIRIVRPALDGVSISGASNSCHDSTVIRAGRNGFLVQDPGNSFSANRSTTARNLDLEDLAGSGSNNYQDNVFRRTNL